MDKLAVDTSEAAPPAGPYSQGVRAGPFLFVAGQVPATPEGEMVDGDFEAQARQVFANLSAIAEAAGSTLAHAVQVGVYLRSRENFPRMNELFAEYFSEPRPARTTIQAVLPGFEIEIDAVMVLPNG